MGATTARWPMSRSVVLALSSPSWSRTVEAAWRVGYGGDLSFSVPSGFRHCTYQGPPRSSGGRIRQ